MGFKINKRIKIAKGITLNVGKKGISTSVKVGNTTINSKGRVSTTIMPGVSYTTNLKSNNKAKNNKRKDTVVVESNEPIPKSKKVSVILCCLGFLGFGGIHKFYEGKPILGIIYLLTGGLFAIGTIIDLIALLSKPSTYYV